MQRRFRTVVVASSAARDDVSARSDMPVVETKRLVLREITDDDADFIARLLNEPTFLRYIGDRGVRTAEDAHGYISKVAQESYRAFGFGLYLVVTKSDATPIGMCGLMQKPWLDAVDIAYAFVPEAGGYGYAVEAAGAVLAYGRARLQLARVVAVVTPDNAKSMRLLEKLGFRRAGEIADPRTGSELQLFSSEPASGGQEPFEQQRVVDGVDVISPGNGGV